MAECEEEEESKTNEINKDDWNWSQDVFEVDNGTGMMVVNINGNFYPPITMKKSVLWLKDNFCPSIHDVFIVSYPKCGTTWMQKICVEIMKLVLTKTNNTKQNEQEHDNKYLNIDCSNLYLDGKFSNIYYLESMINNDINYFLSYIYCTDKLYKLNNNFLRFWKSHSFHSSFPIKIVNGKNTNKYILIIRDPKDVVISYYEYLKLVGYPIFKCSFNKFFELFTLGLVPGGNYWEWVINWNNNKNDNILWIYYEDLKNDTIKQIYRIIKFLNLEHILNKDDEIKMIIKNSSFSEMKSMVKNGKDNYPINFFRKGIIGDHKNILTQKQMNTLNMITKSKFHHSSNIKYRIK